MDYVYLGSEKKSFTNKDGLLVEGYNVYLAYSGEGHLGFKPMMKFNQERRSLGYIYCTKANYDKLGYAALSPLARVYLTFNQFGGIDSVRAAK